MTYKYWLAMTAAVLNVGTAYGQDVASSGEEEEELRADTIIVVGQKREESIKDVTASVDVVSAAEIAREPITDLYDIVDRIPNVTPSFGGLGFSIRGVDQRGIAGNGATLTIYVDDSPLSNFTTFFGPLDSWDLGQVEVYRGPQSTNFGRNTIAGAIYVRTQDPTYEWDFKARAEAGNNGILQGAIAGGGPIIDDVLAFRVAANYRESDGFIFNTFLDEEADATELTTGRFKLLFEPTDNLSIISTSSYTDNFAGEDGLDAENGVPGAILTAGEVLREVTDNVAEREGTETFIQSINATWDISDRFSVQSITTYQNTDYVRIEDFDNSSEDFGALDRIGGDEAISEELRLNYTGDRLAGTLGFYYFNSDEFFEDTFAVPTTAVNPTFPDDLFINRDSMTTSETENYAFFLDGDFAVTSSLDLLFGIRYDNEQQENNTVQTTSLSAPPPPNLAFLLAQAGMTEETTEAEFDAWLPKGGVRWTANDNATFAFVVQRAYRAGGSAINFATGDVEDFDPEFLINYELSARTEFFDNRLQWNSNIYYSDWTDQQVSEPLAPPFQNFTRTVNAGESSLYGFETDLTFAATDRLDIYGSVGYSIAEFDDFVNDDFDPTMPESEMNQANFAGNQFPFAPEWSLNAGFDYNHELGFFLGLDVNYQTSVFQLNENLAINEFGERTLVNMRAGYRVTDNVILSGYVRNLFDEDFFTSLNRGIPGSGFARLGDQRTFAVRLDVDF
ncbi:MAG: TonB-dependent receptor [Pseudomonadota bacterium]